MFQTLSMDVQPIATVNGPALASASALPSVPIAPPPAPAGTEHPPTAANSTGPASPHDGSEDAANGNGGSRRPGNLWTTEDREDMFNRREAGEGWETICADYPNRSRHAMQQQYSMMKKQKALADGTWASNRRGRKRRNPAPERPPAAVKRDDADEHMTEGDDYDEGATSDDPDENDETNGRTSNGRPNQLMRSSTEPAKSGKPRAGNFTVANSTPTNGNRASSQQAEAVPDSTYAGGRSSKKRRLSGDVAANTHLSATPSDVASGSTLPTNVMLDYDELFAFIKRGVEHARRATRTLEEERAIRTRSYADAIKRANRRCNEAQDHASYLTYEHGEAVKRLRAEFAVSLKTKTNEHREAIEKLKAEQAAERAARDEHASAQMSRIDDLQKKVTLSQQDAPERERDMAAQIESLGADKAALEAAKREWEAAAEAPARDVKGQPQSTLLTTKARAEPPIPGDGPEPKLSNVDPLGALDSSVFGNCNIFAADFDAMASRIQAFHAEFEDLGHKRTVQGLGEIVAAKDLAVSRMQVLVGSVQQLHHAFLELEKRQAAQTGDPAKSAMPDGRKKEATMSATPDVKNKVHGVAAPAAPGLPGSEATSTSNRGTTEPMAAPPIIHVEALTASTAPPVAAAPTASMNDAVLITHERQPSPLKQETVHSTDPKSIHEEPTPVSAVPAPSVERADVEMGEDDTPQQLQSQHNDSIVAQLAAAAAAPSLSHQPVASPAAPIASMGPPQAQVPIEAKQESHEPPSTVQQMHQLPSEQPQPSVEQPAEEQSADTTMQQ